ncbi:COP9 signalosome complex subunit 6a-like [Vitis riparia]|uniref:COP9 signalosome complex subunit 6a-like n=1 Tax=Vitis riparia TaxID=96939 RepID=UPI00155A6CF9|nr:COP9 signalosome complex subunit 6a-like [Vitis riparia]
MASSSSSGLTFKLHPLVIVNISDHYTRVKSQTQPPHLSSNGGEGAAAAASPPPPPPRVFGCVIGVQRGRTVEIFNSFELLYDPSTHSLDRSFLEKKQELYKKVFPNFYILGWYSTGSDAQESDMHIHKALMDINESPVYVLLNPSINHAQKDLPVTIYESELHVIDGIPQLIFVRANYTIETVEAERISVDHVAHLKPSDGGSAATQLAAHLTGIHSAIKMLNSRIRVLHHYLLAMQKGVCLFCLFRNLNLFEVVEERIGFSLRKSIEERTKSSGERGTQRILVNQISKEAANIPKNILQIHRNYFCQVSDS